MRIARLILLLISFPVLLPAASSGCDSSSQGLVDSGVDAPELDGGPSGQLQLHFLYVHGVKSCPEDRMVAEGSLVDLETAVNAALPTYIAEYEAAHPGVEVVTSSARANLYTAPASPHHPSDSTDPLLMDDWEAGDPGCTATAQGEPCTAAYEWRHRLAQEIQNRFPADAKNIILIGHSTGGRAAFEVAANVGAQGVGSHDWGVQDRIAGVVSAHGMIDSLGTDKYDFAVPGGFVLGCKYGDIIAGWGESCAMGNGWCEYAGDVSGFDAADWVAQNKHALMLMSHASCSPSAFSGQTDGALPLDAQGSPLAVGTAMTVAPDSTWRPAHGVEYGSFCHSAITNPGDPDHGASVDSAREQMLEWLFTRARRVADSGVIDVEPLGYQSSTDEHAIGGVCPAGHVDAEIDAVGTCRHPGLFDGDDHAIADDELAVSDGVSCEGALSWTQAHDADNSHAARLWWKSYSVPTGAGVVESLVLD